jgi:CubicO group peptidase (beta-lactamase class C family)
VTEISTEISGDTKPGFERVADAFAATFAGLPDMGAALAVFVGGEPVVNLWGGFADQRAGQRWSERTASVVFSCTKGLVSIIAARLVEEGRLDYDVPVARYWPEFAAAGKERITVGDALSHRAGLSAPNDDFTPDDVVDWEVVTAALARQAPLWARGEGHAYHAITHGWIVGEVIRRVTGKSVGAVFAEMIARPLGAAAWIGLPDGEASRMAHLTVDPSLVRLWEEEREKAGPDGVNWPYRAMTLGRALPAELVTPDSGFNDPRLHAAEIPGAGGIATADALARIWSATVVPTDGVRLISDAVIRRATVVQSEGAPVFPAIGPFPRWGMGFQLDSEARRFLTGRGFGHAGAGGQLGFADPAYGVGFGFVTNYMQGPEDTRAGNIVDALRACLGLA